MKYHPDRAVGDAEAIKRMSDKMALINRAHDVLKDAGMRAYYDRTGQVASTI